MKWYLLLVGVDQVFESDLQLLEAVLEVSALFLHFSHFETRLFSLFLKRLQLLLSQIIEILPINGARTVH
jgi:hypothetical protein